ncbi:MAG: ABC transporter permease [Candidatus Bathyarchaeota archaeon]|nr:ABC transporter permease [Candidatus Bathyarchaeota archaeon]MDH5664537.1 ABC transporter permease [Candidatus Bathyarchaeota archaeon]
MPKWLVVAKNEYRISTSRIRKIRPYFPFLVIGLLAVYVAFIAPRFVDIFIDDFLALLLSQVALAMVQIILFLIFIYFIIIPISGTLREEQTGQVEIFLAAPIRPSDVLLGEFLGRMPFYAIFVTVIIGAFVALLSPLGLDLAQMAIILLIFVVTFLSALWIGTVIAVLLRTKLGKTARGRDIGRALAMIIALPLVVLIYAIQFGGLFEAFADPKAGGIVKTVLSLLPSSWGAEVVTNFANNPGNIGAVGFETLTRCGGLLVFFVAVLWLGAKVADRAYSLEPTTFVASTAKPDGAFYKTVKSLGGGGSFGTLLVSVFKDYGRRLENLSNITYIVGLLFVMTIFAVPKQGPMGPLYIYMLAQFLFPVIAVMITGEATVRGKESLFIFRKAPSGEGRFVKAMLLKGWLLAVPIAGVVTAVTTVSSPQVTIISFVANTGFMMLFIAAYTAFVLGLFLLNPAFSPKSLKLGLNIIIAVFLSIGLFAVSLLSLMRVGVWSETIGGMLYVQLLQVTLSWLVGVVFLYLGKRRLSRIE